MVRGRGRGRGRGRVRDLPIEEAVEEVGVAEDGDGALGSLEEVGGELVDARLVRVRLRLRVQG